jgi:uncharacterized protein DUF3761
MKGPSARLYLVILGLALAASVSCKGGADKQPSQTAASESTPAPADTGSSNAAPAAAVTATATASASSEKPKSKTPTEDSTVRATVDTARKGPTGATALLGQSPPPATPPALIIPDGATAECNDSTYSLSADKAFACKGHGGVMKWIKP